MRKNRIASRYCRLASKNWRIAGVAPAGVERGGEAIRETCALARSRRHREGRGSHALSGAKHRSITSDRWPSGGRQPLIILGLDTTTRSGSAAVLDGDRVLSEVGGDGALTHGQRLPADIHRALEA